MGINEVAFSGGEPLLWWPELLEVVTMGGKSDVDVVLYTSGNDDEFEHKISRLKEAGLKKTIFSLFGPSKEDHEIITLSRGSFQKTITNEAAK